jgi:L-alanine-DL-glutamate epimerase-like enolase superfamily enzyme
LLGGYRDKVPAYASTLTLDSIEEYVELTKDCLARGYKAIKLHLWGRPQQDVAACRAVRETAGPDIRLMVDASGGYDHEQALWVGRELEKLDYYWYEEPVRDYDFYGLAELRRTLTIPILMAETSWGGVFETANNLLGRTGDIVHADVWLNHGVTGCIKTAHLCEAFGVKCQIHGGGRPNLHLICAIKNCEYFESPVPEGRSETGAFQNPPIMPDKDGFVHVPQEPGFGTEPDWEWVEKHTIEQV